ncbi:MAG: phosphoglucosamine mutase [Chitinophagaceae bacterium]|nr:MAG: phosphoglucosamine mutase [Chitinophagaceae bacterium]
MALIKSISGIRGTIGGKPGESLSPLDVVMYTAAFGRSILTSKNKKVIVGRDGRISGPMIAELVTQTLVSIGAEVIDLGLSTTPTVEFAVITEAAAGGIIITASHNPKEWNALKLLNEKGEFISASDGAKILADAEQGNLHFETVDNLGSISCNDSYLEKHIEAILHYELVDKKIIAESKLKIVVDAINSTGAIFVPPLLNKLGIPDAQIIVLNGEVNGKFAHNPEPLPQHLSQLSAAVISHKADLGISVDPDVDRLVLVCEDGTMFGEEYTLVAVADYVLSKRKGNTVSNLSSTKALKDITEKYQGQYFPAAVGEVNVVAKMKEVNAVIGGEGNGGIIVPDFHYGRDALIGIALILSHLAESKKSLKQLRNSYPDYYISKNKIELNHGVDLQAVFNQLKIKYKSNPINTIDGLRIEFDNDWVHLRASNTEPIIRIYAESNFERTAENIANRLIKDIQEFC